jgi:hypothetical protein
LRFFRTIHITLGAAGDVSRVEVEDIESGAVVSAFDGDPMEFFAASESTRCWSTVQIRNERETTSSPCLSSHIKLWLVRGMGISNTRSVGGVCWEGGAGVVSWSAMKGWMVVMVELY